jgi:hypothetical protein
MANLGLRKMERLDGKARWKGLMERLSVRASIGLRKGKAQSNRS